MLDAIRRRRFLTRLACYLTSPAIAAQVRAIVAAEAPDLVLIDAHVPGGAGRSGALRTARGRDLAHLHLPPTRHVARHDRAAQRHARRRPVSPACRRSTNCGRRGIASSRPASAEFDHAPVPGWDMVRSRRSRFGRRKGGGSGGAAVARGRSHAAGAGQLFSTGFEQRSVEKLQRALDALGRLAVSRGRHDRRHRRARRIARSAERDRAQLRRARSDHGARGADSSRTAGTAPRCARCATACRWSSSPGRRRSALCRRGVVESTNRVLASPCPPTPRTETIRARGGRLIADRHIAPRRGGGRRRSPASTARRPPPRKSKRYSAN